MTTPLPGGFGIAIDPGTRQLDEAALFGGSPARVLRLSPAGRKAWAELQAGPVRSAESAALARRLTDTGLAHPRPPLPGQPPDVTVLIPVRDRTDMLDRCLAALAGRYRVVVVDDGSADEHAVVKVAARHQVVLLRRAATGGPAAARNTGLAGIGTEFVAFLDSDCVPPRDWIERLAGHLADPLVGAVAPRITAPPGRTAAGRYAAARGSLDLGDREARVGPATRVGYVPTAALLVRRAALAAVARGPQVFDPALRYGEDVDLVWRLDQAGWRIRYEPAVEVRHDGPDSWPGLLARRFRYGTSAAPLAARHPAVLAPLALQPWPAAAAAALLGRRPLLAALGAAGGWLSLIRTLRSAGLPADGALPATLTAVRQTWLGLGRYGTQFAGPALAAVLARPGGRTWMQRWGRRAAAGSLLLGPALSAWRDRRPDLDMATFTAGHIADDVAYGAGVWAGCLRGRTLRPAMPVISWRMLRIGKGAS
jgi:mycofactocin glycosyltransferase